MLYVRTGNHKFKLDKSYVMYQKKLPEDAICIIFTTLIEKCAGGDNEVITIDNSGYKLFFDTEIDKYNIIGYLSTEWDNLYVAILSDREQKELAAPFVYSAIAIGACIIGGIIYNGCSDIYRKNLDISAIKSESNVSSGVYIEKNDNIDQLTLVSNNDMGSTQDESKSSVKKSSAENESDKNVADSENIIDNKSTNEDFISTEVSNETSDETNVDKNVEDPGGENDYKTVESDNASVSESAEKIDSTYNTRLDSSKPEDAYKSISNSDSINESNNNKTNDPVAENATENVNKTTTEQLPVTDKRVKDTVFYTDESYNEYIYAKGKVREENLVTADTTVHKVPQYILDDFISKGWKINIINEDINYNGLNASGITTYADKTIDIKNNEGLIKRSIVHEIGHFFDCSLGFISESDEFLNDIYPSEKDNFKYTYTTKSKHEISDVYEYFASTFDEYITNPDNLEQCCPRTYEFLKNIV